MLKINKKFAKKYDEYRRKEELQKFKDKFGDVKLSDAKKALNGRPPSGSGGKADTAPSPSASSSDSSESEDSECEGWTPDLEAGFLRVYSALQAGDSRLYDSAVSWFPDSAEEKPGEAVGSDEASAAAEQKEEHRPMFYNEYHRTYLLAGAYEKDEQAAVVEATEADLQEAEQIRKALADSHANASDSDGSSSDNGESDFLLKRAKGGGQDLAEDPMLRLHKFVSDPGDQGGGLELEPDCRDDLAKLKRHWTNESELTDAERYLRDFITKEYWRPRQESQQQRKKKQRQAGQPGDSESDKDEEEAEAELSEDEAFLAKQSAFESRWNLRLEGGGCDGEPDAEFESEYRRTLASGEAAANSDDDEDDNEELFVVKAAKGADCELPVGDAEAAAAEEELRRLEKRRQWKLKDEAGDDSDSDDEAEEAGPAAASKCGVRSYPRRITESLRQSTTEGERARQRAERRERRRLEKLARRRELDRLVTMKEAELERKLERLRRNAGTGLSEARMSEALGGHFLEAEFDPEEHDKRMAGLFNDDFYCGDERAAPDFSEDEELQGDELEEARRLREELEGLRAEDLIRAGPGEADLKCRFNYRQTEPNDFGLSPVEILLADDRELNAWCSVRKASQYKERETDWRERRRYRSSRFQERKARLMPDMVRRLEAAAACADAQSWASAIAANPDGLSVAPQGGADAESRKKRRRKKRKAAESGSLKTGARCPRKTEDAPRCRKRPRLEEQPCETRKPAVAAEAAAPKTSADGKVRLKAKKKKVKSKAGDRLQISEQRLLELGIDPAKFRRMRREGGGPRESRGD